MNDKLWKHPDLFPIKVGIAILFLVALSLSYLVATSWKPQINIVLIPIIIISLVSILAGAFRFYSAKEIQNQVAYILQKENAGDRYDCNLLALVLSSIGSVNEVTFNGHHYSTTDLGKSNIYTEVNRTTDLKIWVCKIVFSTLEGETPFELCVVVNNNFKPTTQKVYLVKQD